MIPQVFLAGWVVADHLATDSFMSLDLRQTYHSRAIAALRPKRCDDLLDDTRGSSDLDVLRTHRTVLVVHKPVLDAQLTKQIIAVVTLFSVTTQL